MTMFEYFIYLPFHFSCLNGSMVLGDSCIIDCKSVCCIGFSDGLLRHASILPSVDVHLHPIYYEYCETNTQAYA